MLAGKKIDHGSEAAPESTIGSSTIGSAEDVMPNVRPRIGSSPRIDDGLGGSANCGTAEHDRHLHRLMFYVLVTWRISRLGGSANCGTAEHDRQLHRLMFYVLMTWRISRLGGSAVTMEKVPQWHGGKNDKQLVKQSNQVLNTATKALGTLCRNSEKTPRPVLP